MSKIWDILSGIGIGAGTGFLAGGPVGAGIGAGVGGLAGGVGVSKYKKESKKTKKQEKEYVKQLVKFSKEKFTQKDRLTKEQQGLLKQTSKMALKDQKGLTPLNKIKKPSETQEFKTSQKGLMDIFSQTPEAYEKFKAPIMREFQEQTLPKIGEQFSAVTGGQRGSSFQNALAESAVRLQEHLSSQKAGMQYDAREQALRYAGVPLAEQQTLRGLGQDQSRTALSVNPYESWYRPPGFAGQQSQQGTIHSLLSSFAGPAAAGAGYAMGGPIGSAIGGGAGDWLSKLFGSNTQAKSTQPFNLV